MSNLLTEADKELFRRVWSSTGTHEAYEELYDKLLVERGRTFISQYWNATVMELRQVEEAQAGKVE
jgi:hypothetical protein